MQLVLPPLLKMINGVFLTDINRKKNVKPERATLKEAPDQPEQESGGLTQKSGVDMEEERKIFLGLRDQLRAGANSVRPPLFQDGQRVVDDCGREYEILFSPNRCVTVPQRRRSYVYRKAGGTRVEVRDQFDMEDGRYRIKKIA